VLGRFTGLITRGLAEMTRIGVAYGANPLTFLSMAGVGDLFLTCSSLTSRNYTVGVRLGRGESLDDVLNTLGSVAEGVTTAKGLKAIADNLDVPAPLADAVRELCSRIGFWADVGDGMTGIPSAV
jgi:glycerol-3-phosphate dehydrogenase